VVGMKKICAGAKDRAIRPTYFIFVFAFSVVALFSICLIINYQYMPKAFVYDGLSSILNYRKFTFWNYINPFYFKGSLRFVTYFIQGIVFGLVGYNVSVIGPILIVFNFLISLVVYYIATKISGRFLIGFCVALCYVLSHFAYYQIMETFAFMEGLALLFSLLLLHQLYRYINAEKNGNPFYIAQSLYLLASFTHERYIVLFPIFVIAIILRTVLQSESWKNKRLLVRLSVSVLLFGLLLSARFLLLGRDALRGTGGTNIIDTFSVFSTLKNIFVQILALFGISYGPTYLMGTSYSCFSASDWILVGFYLLCVVAVLVWVLVIIIKKSHLRKPVVSNVFLFGSFILGCDGQEHIFHLRPLQVTVEQLH
jgi:hypothetical protein